MFEQRPEEGKEHNKLGKHIPGSGISILYECTKITVARPEQVRVGGTRSCWTVGYYKGFGLSSG